MYTFEINTKQTKKVNALCNLDLTSIQKRSDASQALESQIPVN